MPKGQVELRIKALGDFSDVQSNIQEVQKYLSKLQLPDNLKGNFKGIFGDLEKEMSKYQKMLDSNFKSKGDVTGLEKSGERISSLINRIQNEMKKISPNTLEKAFQSINTEAIKEATQQVANLKQQLLNTINQFDTSQLTGEFADLEKAVDNALSKMGNRKELSVFKEALAAGDIEKAEQSLHRLEKGFDKLSDSGKLKEGYGQGLKELQEILKAVSSDPSFQKLVTQLEEAKEKANTIGQTNLTALINGFNQGAISVEDFARSFLILHNETLGAKTEMYGLNSELDEIKSKIKYFFGLNNAINLFKRAVTSAFNTVKELDAAMTEIAVVSEFDISDMWDRLPEFTNQANQLGVAVKEAYSATTLFVQQGLNLNESMELSNETLKMARIAGMDAAEATNSMTAALRGFNMELNETSAQRVNDVYSKLAAITAADTREISTAMTKTASIANSANMEFETTAAFLSQIIETTRESAETAGTAMKTVIARFQELKKDPAEIGEVDGEIVDANKIETALRTIGVSLRDTSGQFRELDDVFLEIASKWDDLDTNTQRYIATMAAGSRQQSRFIAMMSNYDRTMELVGAANNSAGASQEQFEKTLDSLESKLAKLKNAWDEFSMGLANNEVIKLGIDVLTKLLETLNKLTDGFGDVGGSIAKLAIAFGAIKGGRALFGKLFTGPGGQLLFGQAEKAGANAGLGFIKAFSHKIATTKEYSKDSGEKFFKGFFKDTSGLKLPPDVLNQPLNKLFESVDAEQIDASAVQKALEGTFNKLGDLNWEAQKYKKERILELINKGDLESLKQADSMMKELGETTQATEVMFKKTSGTMKADMQAVAGSIAAAGAALVVLGNHLEQVGAEKAGKVITKLGMGLSAIGTILSVTIPLAAKTGMATIMGIPVIGWVLGVVAAITAIGFAIADIVETAEEKSARLAEQTKAAQDAANEAKSAYDNLLSSFEGYDAAQETLDGLVKGTEEWTNALIKANEEVLKMLETYPELAQYITRGADGQLIISDEGRKAVIQDQKNKALNAQQLAIGASMYERSNEYENKQKELRKEYGSRESIEIAANWIDSNGNQISGQDLLQLYNTNRELAENLWQFSENNTNKIPLDEYINNVGLSEIENITVDISKAVNALDEYTKNENSANSEIRGLVSSLLTVGASDALASSKYSSEIQDAFASMLTSEGFSSDIQDESQIYRGMNKEQLRAKYEEITGLDGEGMSKQALRDALAQNTVLDKQLSNMENFYAEFGSLNEKEQSNLIKAIKKDGKGLTNNIAKSYIDEENLEASFEKNTGLNLEEVASMLGMEVDEFKAYLIENAEKAVEAYNLATQKLSDNNLDDITKALENTDLSVGAVQGLTDHFYGTLLAGGRDATRELSTVLLNAIPKNTEDAERFVNLLNNLDWSSQESIRGFSEAIKDSGIRSGLSEDELNQLEERIIELANVSDDLTFDKVKEELKSLQELADDIEGREDTERTFSDADREKLLELGVDESQFVATAVDEWVYVGESLEELLNDINKHTAEILGEVSNDINEKVEQGRLWEEAQNSKWFVEGGGITTAVSLIEGLLDSSVTYFNKDRSWNNASADRVISAENIKALAELVGVNTEGLNPQAIIDKLRESYDLYWGPNGSIFNNNLKVQEQDTTKTNQINYSNMESGQEILSTGENDIVSSDAEAALDAKVAQEGLGDRVEETTKHLKDFDKAFVKAHVVDSKKAAKEIDDLNESISDNYDAFKKAEKGSWAYDEALKKITENAKDVFGEHIDESFVETYAKDFLLLEQGGEVAEAAFARISKAAATMYLETLDFGEETEAKLSEIKSLTSELDGLDFGISGTADFSDIFNQLVALMGSAEDAAKYLESIGYETTYEPTGRYQIIQISEDDPRYVDTGSVNDRYLKIPVYKVGLSKNKASGTGYKAPKGGGGSKTASNSYDKQYNLVQDINSSMREREKIERKYNQLLEDREATGEQLKELSIQELEQLKKQEAYQKKMLALRKQERAAILGSNSQYAQYASYNSSDNTIEIDWGALDKLAKSNPDKYEEISDYINALEDIQDKIQDAEDALLDIADAVKEIERRGEDAYIDLEDRVINALVEQQSRIIESQERINDAITEAASDLTDAIQGAINKLRQDRENEKTEDSLAEKERRLAYLRQDTSGANDLEILRLEKEIAEERESYGDSLVDQALQELQDQNDEAAEQRDRQTQLLQDQLEWAEKNGAFNAEAEQILKEGLASGNLDEGSRLFQLLKEIEGASAMSGVRYEKWLADLKTTIAEAYLYGKDLSGEVGDVETNRDYMAEMLEIFSRNGGKIDDDIWELNTLRNKKIAENPELAKYGVYNTKEELLDRLKQGKTITSSNSTEPSSSSGRGKLMSLPAKTNLSSSEVTSLQQGLNDLIDAGYLSGPKLAEDGVKGTNTNNKLRALQGLIGATVDGDWGPNTYEALRRSKFTAFKTGGLADFTGPAWLDGTKSKPELVLNARDTENFLVLKDVLASLLHLPTSTSSNGDNFFDINIQVDEIADDYDVDQVVERVKQKIYEDSMYRNNNMINLLR